jgi:hypothetical protein
MKRDICKRDYSTRRILLRRISDTLMPTQENEIEDTIFSWRSTKSLSRCREELMKIKFRFLRIISGGPQPQSSFKIYVIYLRYIETDYRQRKMRKIFANLKGCELVTD